MSEPGLGALASTSTHFDSFNGQGNVLTYRLRSAYAIFWFVINPTQCALVNSWSKLYSGSIITMASHVLALIVTCQYMNRLLAHDTLVSSS